MSIDKTKRSSLQSLIHSLAESLNLSSSVYDEARIGVVRKALELLNSIHDAFATPLENGKSSQRPHQETGDEALEDAKRRRIIHALLDLISLEGLYPSLSSDVGIPLDQRVISILPTGVSVRKNEACKHLVPQDESSLRDMITVLMGIVLDPRPGIQLFVSLP